MTIKRYKKDTPVYFDYKDVRTLQRFVDIYGQIKQIGKYNTIKTRMDGIKYADRRQRRIFSSTRVAGRYK